jgi:signal transduction histidine kinase
VGWAVCGIAVLLASVAVAWTVADGRTLAGDVATGCVMGVGSTLLAAFVLSRHPGSAIGWLFGIAGLSRAIAVFAAAWSVRALRTHPGSLPGGSFASWVQAWSPLPALALVPVIVVLFPDGRLPGARWRVVPVLAGVALVLFAVVVPIGMWPYRGPRLLPDAPTPDTTGAQVTSAFLAAAAVITVVAVLLALAAVVLRMRRARGEERQQLKWFGYGATCAVVLNLVSVAPGAGWLRLVGVLCVLTGIGLGIFRYRLYDVDRLINRTLVYGVVSVALVGVFAALDVTLVTISGQSSVVIAAAVAFAVALLLRPARDRAQDLIDRTFNRRTHDAVRIMRDLGQRVGQDVVAADTVRATLREALRDPDLTLLYYVGQDAILVDQRARRADAEVCRSGQVVDPVTVNGRDIALLVHTRTAPSILAAVVQAGATALEHARLQTELLVQLDEIRASRTRLAAAGDAERRRIERDLHDGAQQRLVGLALHIQSTRRHTSPSPALDELLTFTVDQLASGVEDIRALVHGILPAALVASGLAAALQELTRPGAVSLECDIRERPQPDIEAAGWFVACEAVANATKHARGQHTHIRATTCEQRLIIEVSDSGPGGADSHGNGLRSLADRVEAHGGQLDIDSPPGGGTRVTVNLPCAS